MKCVRYVNMLLPVLIVIAGACAMQKESQKLARLLPEAVEGWRIGRVDQIFNRDNL